MMFFYYTTLKNQTGSKIAFVKEQSAIVFTSPKESVAEFINQRKRWAAKSSSYTDATAQWISIVVFSDST